MTRGIRITSREIHLMPVYIDVFNILLAFYKLPGTFPIGSPLIIQVLICILIY